MLSFVCLFEGSVSELPCDRNSHNSIHLCTPDSQHLASYITFLWCIQCTYLMNVSLLQFRNPTVTSECLFALINGDDVFNTYAQMSDVSTIVWVFSKIYLYVFVALFIYTVLSVFIALISDTYETLNVSVMHELTTV